MYYERRVTTKKGRVAAIIPKPSIDAVPDGMDFVGKTWEGSTDQFRPSQIFLGVHETSKRPGLASAWLWKISIENHPRSTLHLVPRHSHITDHSEAWRAESTLCCKADRGVFQHGLCNVPLNLRGSTSPT